MFTAESLDRMRERVAAGRDPWRRAAAKLVEEAEDALESGVDPDPYTGRHSLEFYHAAIRQGERARLYAYGWLVSGDAGLAEAGIAYLAAWAGADPPPASDFDPEIRYPNTGMEVARAAIPFLEAYDLLAAHRSWDDGDRADVETWFRSLVDPILQGKERWQKNDYFNRQYFQNHLTAHTMGLAAIGYALGDRDLVQYALDHPDNDRDYKTLIEGMILMPGDETHHREPDDAPPPEKGEIADRYRHYTAPDRGLAYTHLSLSQLLYIAEMAWNNGVDFYSYEAEGGENLKLPLRFYADFYRTRDAGLHHGLYRGERFQDFYPLIYEIANRRYPDTPEIVALLRSLDRLEVPRHPHAYFFYPVLTHGERRDAPLACPGLIPRAGADPASPIGPPGKRYLGSTPACSSSTGLVSSPIPST